MTDGTDRWDVADVGVGEATVLVVDDETSVLDSFELALEAAGHEVIRATNGGEALVALDPGVDVVLLDRRMPGMSGDEVLEHVQEWQPGCRVVMVTAVEPDVDIVDMGFDDYLTKPVTQDEIVDTVVQLLRFDRYEELLTEYHATTRKHATLAAAFDQHELRDNEAVQRLVDRRERLREALERTIAEFSDDEIRDVLLQAHGELP